MAAYNHAIFHKIMKSRNKVAKAHGKALKYQAKGAAVSSVIGSLAAKWDEYQKQQQAAQANPPRQTNGVVTNKK